MASNKISNPSISSKSVVRKSILRNVEVPIKHRKSVSESSKKNNIENENNENILTSAAGLTVKGSHHNKTCSTKYHTPQLNTVLKLKEKFDKIHLSEPKKIDSISQLTPKTKNLVTQEMTKHLNFPLEKQIFKDLIPINVNDSVSMIPEIKKPIRKKYTLKTKKDPIPELSDFLKPIEPLEHILPLYDCADYLRKPKNDNFKEYSKLHSKYHPEF